MGFDQDGKLALWDIRNGRLIKLLPQSGGNTVFLGITPDGEYAIAQRIDPSTWWGRPAWGDHRLPAPDNSVQVWKLPSGKPVYSIRNCYLNCVTSDSRRIYGIERYYESRAPAVLSCWDVRTGARLFDIGGYTTPSYGGDRAVETPDLRHLVYSDLHGISLFNLPRPGSRVGHSVLDARLETKPFMKGSWFGLSGMGKFIFYQMRQGVRPVIVLYSIAEKTEMDRIVITSNRKDLGPILPSASVIACFRKRLGFIAFTSAGEWVSYDTYRGLRLLGRATTCPESLEISPDERLIIATYAHYISADIKTDSVSCYDAGSLKLKWSKEGNFVGFCGTREAFIKNHAVLDKVSLRNGRVTKSVRLQNAGF